MAQELTCCFSRPPSQYCLVLFKVTIIRGEKAFHSMALDFIAWGAFMPLCDVVSDQDLDLCRYFFRSPSSAPSIGLAVVFSFLSVSPLGKSKGWFALISMLPTKPNIHHQKLVKLHPLKLSCVLLPVIKVLWRACLPFALSTTRFEAPGRQFQLTRFDSTAAFYIAAR